MISLWRRQERYRIIYVWNTTKELTNVSNILSLTLLMIIGLIEMIYLWNQLNALYFGHLHCLYPLYPPDWTSNQGVSNLLYSVTLCSKHKDCREGGWGCAHCALCAGACVLARSHINNDTSHTMGDPAVSTYLCSNQHFISCVLLCICEAFSSKLFYV